MSTVDSQHNNLKQQESLLLRKKALSQLNTAGKKVLVRVDFNVPLKGKGSERVVADDTRLLAALPTIKALSESGAKVILLSHLGRPEGRDANLSLDVVAKKLAGLLNKEVAFAADCRGEIAQAAVDKLSEGGILLLENTRFYSEEENLEPKKYGKLSAEQQRAVDNFVQEIATLGDVFVNDAFGAAHRKHASTAGLAAALPSAYGLLIEKELRFLEQALMQPQRPFVAVLGGAKVSDKIAVVTRLLEKADSLIIGGAMANTFLVAKGVNIGASRFEAEQIDLAKDIMQKAADRNVKILLPIDYVYGEVQVSDGGVKFVWQGAGNTVPEKLSALDIGAATQELFCSELAQAGTVLWNGPMGVFEVAEFSAGTKAVAEMLVKITNTGAVTIVGGGDSAAAIKDFGLELGVSHVSTGGGASLEFLEGKDLPGISALSDKI